MEKENVSASETFTILNVTWNGDSFDRCQMTLTLSVTFQKGRLTYFQGPTEKGASYCH